VIGALVLGTNTPHNSDGNPMPVAVNDDLAKSVATKFSSPSSHPTKKAETASVVLRTSAANVKLPDSGTSLFGNKSTAAASATTQASDNSSFGNKIARSANLNAPATGGFSFGTDPSPWATGSSESSSTYNSC